MNPPLRVWMCRRVDAERTPGGDSLHASEAAEAGRALGADVRVWDGLPTQWDGVDAVHVWNLTRPYEAWVVVQEARRRGIPVVLSPLHHDLHRYRQEGGGRFSPLSWLGVEEGEALRLRWLRHRHPDLARLLPREASWRELQRELLRSVALVLWTCSREEEEVTRLLLEPGEGVPGRVVHTAVFGVDKENPKEFQELSRWDRRGILCVGRIEPLKNSLAVLDALGPVGHPLAFIGAMNPRHPRYAARFRARLRRYPHVQWFGSQPLPVVRSAMAASAVHVLASWGESVGRVSLEAALQGCAVVSTTAGYLTDLLGEVVLPCDPADLESIRRAVERGLTEGPHPEGRERVLARCSWEKVAPGLERAWHDAAGRKGGRP